MAITAPTMTSDSQFQGYLTPNMASDYFAQARRISVVQQLARQVPLGINGETIPVIMSKVQAGWVSEGGKKPASQGTIALKSMQPKKIAAIAVVSAEVVRANPGGYMGLIRPDIAEAFALAFDAAVLHGTATPFGGFLDQTTKAVELGSSTPTQGSVYQDLNQALRLLVQDSKKLTGWALDDAIEPTLNGAVDASGRPLFVEAPPVEDTASQADNPGVDRRARTGRLMGRPSFMSEGVGTADLDTVVGYAGDWRQIVWGTVGGISYDVSDQATVTINNQLVSLWENNLVAIRAEAEYGVLINDVSSFVRITNLVGS